MPRPGHPWLFRPPAVAKSPSASHVVHAGARNARVGELPTSALACMGRLGSPCKDSGTAPATPNRDMVCASRAQGGAGHRPEKGDGGKSAASHQHPSVAYGSGRKRAKVLGMSPANPRRAGACGGRPAVKKRGGRRARLVFALNSDRYGLVRAAHSRVYFGQEAKSAQNGPCEKSRASQGGIVGLQRGQRFQSAFTVVKVCAITPASTVHE